VGVLATRGTLASDKFQALLQAQSAQVRFVLQACAGLAAAIEHDDTSQIRALCARYTGAMGHFGAAPGAIDTVVLGCTHYAFAAAALQTLLGPDVRLLDAGQPVAQRTRSLLGQATADNAASTEDQEKAEQVELWTTGVVDTLRDATQRWLKDFGPVQAAAIP